MKDAFKDKIYTDIESFPQYINEKIGGYNFNTNSYKMLTISFQIILN